VDLEGGTRVGPARDDVTVVEVDGCASLYSPATANVVSLNETATQIWYRCDGSRTLGDIVDDVAAYYGVSPEAIAAQVSGVVAGLVEQQLLQHPATR
jgi:Coenzyme PQQ synthesis protein D (PqqD)